MKSYKSKRTKRIIKAVQGIRPLYDGEIFLILKKIQNLITANLITQNPYVHASTEVIKY